MLYQSESREKILNALSDLILIIQFICLVFGARKNILFSLGCVSPPAPVRSSCMLFALELRYFPEDYKGQVLNIKILNIQ